MGTSRPDETDQRAISSSSSSAGAVNTAASTGTWYGVRLPPPLSFLLDYSDRLRSSSSIGYYEPVIDNNEAAPELRPDPQTSSSYSAAAATLCSGRSSESSSGEVAIRISGTVERNRNAGLGSVSSSPRNQSVNDDDLMGNNVMPVLNEDAEGSSGIMASGRAPLVPSSLSLADSTSGQDDVDAGNVFENNIRGLSSHESSDFQQLAKLLEQVLPFSLLLLVVFVRQHLQGFIITIWISIVMFKSNEIVKKQTALKGDRKVSVLVGISFLFMLHVMCIYWWYQDDDLLYSPLILLPPKSTPHFWHAIFIVLINDVLVRQAAMSFKCLLLIYFKNDRGHSFRLQAQILTLVEHILLLYRTLLPTPIWYRFFLNREYGSLFSSLTTGLYLTFKLTSIVEKVQCCFSALKALSGKDILYGVHATKEQSSFRIRHDCRGLLGSASVESFIGSPNRHELNELVELETFSYEILNIRIRMQVNAAGDLCAICQEKMHGPILLRCKHIFCEECVSEWFDRERTCPLCRALVKAGDIRSFGDGSTSLFFQLC